MKCLGLHGYLMTGDFFSKRLKDLLPKEDILCPNGPLIIDNTDKKGHGWWLLPSKEHVRLPHKYDNLQDTFKYLQQFCSDHNFNPDILIGFSQGSVLSLLLLYNKIFPNIKKVILLSSSDIMDYNYSLSSKLNIPSLHFIGSKDPLVLPSESLNISNKYFDNPLIYYHPHGHVIPSGSSSNRQLLQKFISSDNL